MAGCIESLGTSFIQKSSPLLPSSSSRMLRGEQSLLFSQPALFLLRRRSFDGLKRVARAPVAAAVTEKVVKVEAEKPVRFKVRAALTVRKKKEEDLKEKISSQIDAFSDKIGRNVVLELVSTENDPCKSMSFIIYRDLLQLFDVPGLIIRNLCLSIHLFYFFL